MTEATEQETAEVEEYGEAEAVAVLEQRQRRKGEIRESIRRLDEESEELGRAAATFLADGEEGEGIPEALAGRREALRGELADFHSALAHLDTLIAEAEEDLQVIRQEEATAAYAGARDLEQKAATKVEQATRTLRHALGGFREASRATYALGLAAHIESSIHYMRRRRLSEFFLGTHLGEYSEALRTPARFHVDSLAGQLDAVLPDFRG